MPLYLLLLFLCLTAGAHQSSLNSSGRELFWADPNVGVTIRSSNNDGLSDSQVNSIIRNSLDQWNNSSRAKFIPVSGSINEIRFENNWIYGSAVIGLTEVSYGASGAIQKATILLNDQKRFLPYEGMGSAGEIFLGDVVTHEMGHFAGLSHSEVMNSSMFYSSFSGQSTVAGDDKAGIRKKYDTGFGTIKGFVKGGQGIGVLGVHVQAISRKTGEAIGGFTNDEGYFSIGGLELSDTYYLYTSPMKNPDSLPVYFSNAQTSFCPGKYVGSFFTACGRNNDGKPQGITLTSSYPVIDVGTVTINCSLKTDLDYDYQKVQSDFQRQTIFDYKIEQKNEKAFAGWFKRTSSYSWSGYDKLRIDLSDYPVTSNMYLKLNLVSYPFGTPLGYELSVYRDTFLLTRKIMEKSLITGTYNTDSEIYIPLFTGTNVFDIDLRSQRLDSSTLSETFPSYLQFANDEQLPYLIIASISEDTLSGKRIVLDSQANLSDNSTCLDAPFTYAVKKTSETSQSITQADQTASAAACGTIDPPGSGPGSSLPLMAAGFFLVLLASILTKPRKKFLS